MFLLFTTRIQHIFKKLKEIRGPLELEDLIGWPTLAFADWGQGKKPRRKTQTAVKDEQLISLYIIRWTFSRASSSEIGPSICRVSLHQGRHYHDVSRDPAIRAVAEDQGR
jgi:hypothetical protein